MKVGVAVTLTGLKRSDLNGRRGYLCGPQSLTTAGRWPVQLTSSHAGWHDADLACKRLLVREENLVAAPAADALIESLLTDPDCLLCILGQLETAAQLGAAAAVACLWRAQCQDEDSPLWAQLFARHYAPLSQAGGQSDAVAGTPEALSRRGVRVGFGAATPPPLSPKERARLYSTARAAYRLRAELPPATCSAAFDFAQNVRRLDDGTFVSQADTRRLDSQPIVRRASHVMPLVGNLGYFEASGLNGSSVGLVRGPRFDPKMHTGHIGWKRTSYALHSDDGSKWRKDSFYSCGEEGELYYPAGFGPNATVGVGFDFEDSSIFFTLNGQFLGDAFERADDSLDHALRVRNIHRPTFDADGGLHAAVALHEPGDSARFNLGQERFAFDLEALALARQRTRAIELEACVTEESSFGGGGGSEAGVAAAQPGKSPHALCAGRAEMGFCVWLPGCATVG